MREVGVGVKIKRPWNVHHSSHSTVQNWVGRSPRALVSYVWSEGKVFTYASSTPLPVGFGVLAFFDDFLTMGWYNRLNLTTVAVDKTALRSSISARKDGQEHSVKKEEQTWIRKLVRLWVNL